MDAPIFEAIGSAVGYSNHSPDLSARIIQVAQAYRSSSVNALTSQASGELELKVKTLVLVKSCFGDCPLKILDLASLPARPPKSEVGEIPWWDRIFTGA